MQAAQRFGIPEYYADLDAMLDKVRPDVVHIATPAHTHAKLAQHVIAAGAHVYLEKPLALDEEELRGVISMARSHGRAVCAGHDQLFDPAWLQLRNRLAAGEIGDVTHVESILGYAISGQFGSAVRADPQHWVRQLPGGLFQNTISHPLYRITEFLTDEHPVITANWWAKPGFDFPTELFVHIRGKTVTGTLIFSTSLAPQRITRVYGNKAALEVDMDAQSVVRTAPPELPGAFGKFDAPWRRRREHRKAFWRNVSRFVRSDIHYFGGMGALFSRFHDCVRNPGTPWPVSAEDMLRVTRVMDEIFAVCRRAGSDELQGYPAEPKASVLNALHLSVARKL